MTKKISNEDRLVTVVQSFMRGMEPCSYSSDDVCDRHGILLSGEKQCPYEVAAELLDEIESQNK